MCKGRHSAVIQRESTYKTCLQIVIFSTGEVMRVCAAAVPDAADSQCCRLAAAFDKSAEQHSGDAGTSGSNSGQPSGQQGLLLLIPLMLGLNGKVSACPHILTNKRSDQTGLLQGLQGRAIAHAFAAANTALGSYHKEALPFNMAIRGCQTKFVHPKSCLQDG